MQAHTLFLFLFGILCFASSTATAEYTNSLAGEADSIHITGFIILGLALIGWAFILILLCYAILNIVKKAKTHSVAGLPVKCK